MSINTMPIPAGRALDVLAQGWQAQQAGGLTASWMLHGRPGIGKTDIVQTLATRTGAKLFDLRLTTIEPQDLRGLPYYDHDQKKTVWYRPEDLPDDPAHPAILFLDELTAAAPSLQPTVYGLLQERRVGRHDLPKSCFIIAAGNAVEDGAIAYDMGTALSDRLIHLNVRAEAQDWLTHYAVPHGLDPAIITFIRTRPDLLETTEDAIRRGQTIACTPRSWARVSQIMATFPDRRLRDVMIAGTVGEGPAAEFALIANDISATVQVTDMLAATDRDRVDMYPATMHGLTALTYGLIGIADERTLPGVIAIMADIRNLAKMRSDAAFAALPLGELCTYGFELLIDKALKAGWQAAFLTSPAYATYAAERKVAGLA